MKKTEFTKTAIINSTVKLLKANGKVTIKEISDDAGVNIAAINYHFTDKKSLISGARFPTSKKLPTTLSQTWRN